jgi:hypothetical protein
MYLLPLAKWLLGRNLKVDRGNEVRCSLSSVVAVVCYRGVEARFAGIRHEMAVIRKSITPQRRSVPKEA